MVIQNPTYFKRNVLDGDRTAFYFDSLGDYNRWIDEVEANATGNAREGYRRISAPDYVRKRAKDSWYGTSNPDLVTGTIDTYLFNNELDAFIQNVRSKTVNIDKIDLDQNKRIVFTEQEIGIFSFDLASLGLIPVLEYYSPLLKTIVSGNVVLARKDANNKPIKDENGKVIFYHVFRPEVKRHVVEFNANENGYYSTVLKRVVLKEELVLDESTNKFMFPHRDEIPEHTVEQRQKVGANGKKLWRTTFKKSFVHIPKVQKPLPRIDIIITSSFSGGVDASTQMIYASMAGITLAEKLSKSGVDYRMVVAYPVQTSGGGNKKVYPFVVVKKEGEPLDRNKMAVLMSDGRQFRYRQFKGFYASQYDAGFDRYINVDGIGMPINDSLIIDKEGDQYIVRDVRTLQPSGRNSFATQEEAYQWARTQNNVDRVKIAYMDYLAQSVNPLDVQASKNWDSKIVLSGALSEQEAVNQYQNAVSRISKVM